MYEACAISHFNTTNPATGIPTWWGMVNCMESATNPVTAAQGCATNNGIDWTKIDSCAGSDPSVGTIGDGNTIMHEVGLATTSLQPPHQWTPWVVLNGKPLSSSQLNLPLTRLVCNAYTGTKPAACTVLPLDKREF